MRRNGGFCAVLGLVTCVAGAPAAQAAAKGEVKGLAEFRKVDVLVVDGQRVHLTPATKTKGVPAGQEVPLGYEVKVKGTWRPDGALEARSLEAKPNVKDGSEQKLLESCNGIERLFAEHGRALRVENDNVVTLGRLSDDGPDHKRARRILDRLLPPYVAPGSVRLYVVDNRDWNAFAMANFAIYVHSGLLKDLDDDEVAIVLGHELAHATLEHSHRTRRKGRWARWAAGVAAIGGELLGGIEGGALSALTGLGANAVNNSFSRGFEDQADRVGLRYAYEGGYKPEKAPELWRRFAEKYRDGGKVGNFFFGSHSRSADRAKNLDAELSRNYAKTVDDRPTRR